MKIIVLGHRGNVGKPLVEVLEYAGHQVIKVSRSSGDYQLDYTNTEAIEVFYQEVGTFDAVILVAGRDGYFGPIDSVGYEEFKYSFDRKMMGQFNMVQIGKKYINKGGSFILTSGFLSDVPNSNSLVLGTVNAAVNAFVKHFAELEKSVRINAVSPGVVSLEEDIALGNAKVNSTKLAQVYLQILEGNESGNIFKPWNLNLNGILYRNLLE